MVCALLTGTAVAQAALNKDGVPQFESDVLPILTAHCLKCHGREARKASLDLRTMSLIGRGGESGPVLAPGKPDESPLLDRITDKSMPPEGELPLTAEQIDVIRRWIEAGAPAADASAAVDDSVSEISAADREFWAFQRPVRRDPPVVDSSSRVRTPVDSFLLARLTERGLTFAADADRQTLVRRVYFDLLGLPPTPAEVAEFVNDQTPDAYERLLDRLLASPHFGERWGRHWLDAAGYVDVYGGDNDAGIIKLAEGKWRYRDYVIRSFNSDKPFDQFLAEQLAGDELTDWRAADHFSPAMLDNLIATTFLRASADDTDENELNTADIRHGVLARTVETVASNLLGLTVNCARCHSHKYDPIPQADYYRLTALFTPAFNPQSWLQPRDRALADISPRERAAGEEHNAKIQKQLDESRRQLADVRRPHEEQIFEAKLSTLPEAIRADTKTAVQTPKEKRSEVQKYLADKFAATLQATPGEVNASLSATEREQVMRLETDLAELPKKLQTWGKIQAVYDSGPVPTTYLLRRGNHDAPGDEVSPGFLSVLCDESSRDLLASARPQGSTSGRRLALAQWLTRRDTPAAGLTARVIMNRMWQQLFGAGIVETPDNFGHSGGRPSHPALLDWLAIRWIDEGYRWKPMLKLLMTSTAYRQASSVAPTMANASAGASVQAVDPQAIDPGNQLLWHQRLRRLEAEAIRDAILAAAGTLDLTQFGAPVPVESRPDGSVVIKAAKEGASDSDPAPRRRSIYVLARRNYHLSMLGTFDQPIMATNCTRRNSSAVVLQSLAMLNDDFVIEQAGHFAANVAQLPAAEQIVTAFRRALSREPSAQEAAWSNELLDRQFVRYRPQCDSDATARQKALAHLCQMLLNTSEFLYVQ
ncbi:MAG TPA: PSD1 and planctomycete cytochrome C domain-containing protein [Pirellulales bacterium]|nr:PSD1 and planctomycete cytochrome C domain-containing protein [Pirellulales bacterium]